MYLPTGVFYNPNDYATFLALSIPFGLSLARYCQKLWLRAFGVATALLGSYLVLATGSRANLLAVLLELGFLALFLMGIASRLRWTATMAGIVGVILVITPTLAQAIFQRVTEQLGSILYNVPSEDGSSLHIRLNLVRNGLLFVYQTVGFGVGAGNAEYWMANFARYNTFGILNPHNWWLELLVDNGVFVFAGYILFYLGLVRRLWWLRKRTNGDLRMINEALLLSLIGFSIGSWSSSSIISFTPQWLLFAFSITFTNTQGRKGSSNARFDHSI
jgi:teichuronic acid biosynthesis protein TuaE